MLLLFPIPIRNVFTVTISPQLTPLTTIVDKIFEENVVANFLPFPQLSVAQRNENLQG